MAGARLFGGILCSEARNLQWQLGVASEKTSELRHRSKNFGNPTPNQEKTAKFARRKGNWDKGNWDQVADELCIFRGCQAESVNHPTALFNMKTGSRFGGDSAVGSWVNYGLGSENENLPGYVVMTELAEPLGGSGNWSSGFLPPHFQATRLRSEGSPILDLNPPAWKTRQHQRENLDMLAKINEESVRHHPNHRELVSWMCCVPAGVGRSTRAKKFLLGQVV